ncbi:MAG: hypothetical protein HY748_11580 [Elusimicrobia bacterium]|nr:hypothetical protein [Elusimicrobiota bacterium]
MSRPIVLIAWSLVLAAPLFASGTPKTLSGLPEQDREAFTRIQKAFEDAAGKKDFDLLRPYLDQGFQGRMVSDEDVSGVEGLEAFWKKLGGVSTEQGVHRYTIKLNPRDLEISGDSALARGRTDERFEVRPGEPVDFHSDWEVRLRRDSGGQWKLASMEARLDPVDKVSLALKVAAQRLLNSTVYRTTDFVIARIALPNLKVSRRQDFDGDGVESRGRFLDVVKPKPPPAR